MDLQYTDREAGYLLGVWFVALGFLLVSTTRRGYRPFVGSVSDTVIFAGLCGLVLVGAATVRYRQAALGVPMSVCGGLVVWSVIRTLVDGGARLTGDSAVLAGGLLALGGLFVREGVLIVRGRRRSEAASPPRTRWQWWVGSLVVVTAGSL